MASSTVEWRLARASADLSDPNVASCISTEHPRLAAIICLHGIVSPLNTTDDTPKSNRIPPAYLQCRTGICWTPVKHGHFASMRCYTNGKFMSSGSRNSMFSSILELLLIHNFTSELAITAGS